MVFLGFFKKHKENAKSIAQAEPTETKKYYDLFSAEIKKANEFFENGTVGGKKITLDEQNSIIFKCRTYHEKYLDTLYDFTTVDGINKIPTDKNDVPALVSGGTPCYKLDYVLRLKATNYKKNNIELAIACLKKANEISFKANYTCEKDYMRVVEYLKDAGLFNEAREEETKIKTIYLAEAKTYTKTAFSDSYDKDETTERTDLVESSADTFVCAECAKYTKRIFSKYGKNPKYPLLPKYFKENSPQHKHCVITFHPYYEGTPTSWDCPYDVVEYSNRPFTDERTEEEKQLFVNEVIKRERAEKVKAEYDWLREFVPELAPKSLSSYSRMKNLKSEKYIEILTVVKEKRKELIE